MKIDIFTRAVLLVALYSTTAKCQIHQYIPKEYELVHHIDEYNQPEISQAVLNFKTSRKVKYKSSLEILGDSS